MKRNNWFNRLFFAQEVKDNKEHLKHLEKIFHLSEEMRQMIRETSTLAETIHAHQCIYKNGYCNDQTSPCEWGMFRCDSIENLNLNNLYLGNIYGLFTKPGCYWETHKEDVYGVDSYGIKADTLLYDIVLRQYKRVLIAAITNIEREAITQILKLKSHKY